MSDFTRAGPAQDPDRIGRTGGRPKRAGGISSMLGKALGKGWMKRAKGGNTSQRNGGAGRVFGQRVIVKALVVRHGRRPAGGAAGGWG